MSWPTGETVSPGWIRLSFLMPPDDWIAQSFLGATQYLESVFAWDPTGDVLPQIAAQVFVKARDSVQVLAPLCGSIWWFPNNNMQYINQDPSQGPSQYIKADGSSVLRSAYPDLFAIVGTLYGGDATHFTLPDLRGRVVVGTGFAPPLSPRLVGQTFGEESHTLSDPEIPIHAHTYSTPALTGLAVAPGELPVVIPPATPSLTGTDGGGLGHNNMQPSSVLTAYIWAYP